MSVLIKIRGAKFKFYSTILSEYISPWLDRKEAIKFYERRLKSQLKDEIKKLRIDFPKGFSNTEGHRIS